MTFYAPAPRVGGIKRWCASDVWRLSVAYIGPKSRTERPRKTEIGTEVAHVTRDSDATLTQLAGAYCGGLPHSLFKTVLMYSTYFPSLLWRCWCDWSFARLTAPVVTSIILSCNKIQTGDVPLPAYPGPAGKWPSNNKCPSTSSSLHTLVNNLH